MLVYARTHTQTTWVLDVSPGVGRTPEEPEESRSTKAQYTCRPYRCTQYIRLYICCTAGFDDLGQLLFSFHMSFLFTIGKVEDVTTISKLQSLTSVSIKDCTLRVPNKVFEHVNLPSSDRRPESWFRHQPATRRGVWIGPPSLLVGQSPERRSCQVTGPQVSWTGVQGQVPRTGVQGHVVISRATHFPTGLGVVPVGCSFIGVLLSKSGNKSLFKSMNGLFHTLSHASPLDIHKSHPSQAYPLDIHNSNPHLPRAPMQAVSGPVLSVPLPPSGAPLVFSGPKRARSTALPRDSNDESHAFKSGVGGDIFFCPDRHRSRRLTVDGEQVVESLKLRRTSPLVVIPERLVPPGCRAPTLTPVHVAYDPPPVIREEYFLEETVPGEVGYASPRDLGIRTLLFDTAAILSKHTGRARDSMQALWTRVQAGGPHVPDTSWDLEVGGHVPSEVRVEDLPPSVPSSPELSIPTPITPHGPTLSSLLSDFVWRSPVASSQPYTPYGHTPPSPLYDLVRGPPISNEDTTSCLSTESTGSIREPPHMVALRARRKKARAGNVLSLTRDVSRPSCDFIHCPCAVCSTFRKDTNTWQPGVCRSVAGCKCPRCRRHYDATGHWDTTRAASAQLYLDMVGFDVSVACAQGPLITTTPSTNQSDQPVAMGPVTQPSRHRHRAQYHDRRTQQSLKRFPLVSALQPVLVSSAKLHAPVAQHTAFVRRVPQQPDTHTPVLATTMAALVCASLAQGPSWDKARLLVDSGSEHPPLIRTRIANQLRLEGQVVSAATQANGDILPLSDVGNLELCINGLPITERFLSASFHIMTLYSANRGCAITEVSWTTLTTNCGSFFHQVRSL